MDIKNIFFFENYFSVLKVYKDSDHVDVTMYAI